MTKYILHGGATSTPCQENKDFFFEMVKGPKNELNILCVYFARPKKDWPKLFKQDKDIFKKAAPDKNLNLVVADKQKFIDQLNSADVVYMRGGQELGLLEHLQTIPNLKNLFSGKVVAGSSAGAYILSKYYYSRSRDCIEESIGILPIKTIAHFSQEKKDRYEKLEAYKEPLEIKAIPECKYIVIEK